MRKLYIYSFSVNRGHNASAAASEKCDSAQISLIAVRKRVANHIILKRRYKDDDFMKCFGESDKTMTR